MFLETENQTNIMKDFFKKIIITILTYEARMVLRVKKPTIIAITGSVGKTSTKDALFTVLKPHVTVAKTQKSYNSDFGIPLSILELSNAWGNFTQWFKNIILGFVKIFSRTYPQYLVLEVGADHKGDISRPAQWLRPKYSVFTCFPDVPVHVEFFESPQEVIKEKETLALYTQKNGVLILNHDDPKVLSMKTRFPQKSVSYGISPDATLCLSSFVVKRDQHIFLGTGTIVYNHESYDFTLPHIITRTQILSALPGVLVLLEEGFSFTNAVKGILDLKPTHGRLSVLQGKKDTVLIDDTYNASPVAMMHALDVLVHIPETARKIVVLGDMMELGLHTEEEHRKIGTYITNLPIELVVCIGPRAKFIYEEIQKNSAQLVRWFETSEKAGLFLSENLKHNDCILFKGSQSVRVEKALAYCLHDDINPQDVLVRQEKEWLLR